MKNVNFTIIISTIFLVFFGSAHFVDATFPEKNEKNSITPQTLSDQFGIKIIYPTKTGGNTWFMDMSNPTSDPRFDPLGTITINLDGSWKMQQEQVRMVVYSTDKTTYENTSIPTFSRTQLANNGFMQLPSDWRNFEMTGYVKLNDVNGGNDKQFTWYGRGGIHSDLNPCEGSSTKGALHFDGNTQVEKESWHVKYDFSNKNTSIPPLLGKWTGFKFIVFNQPGTTFPQKVHHEIWVDENNTNNWVKVHSFNDDGFGSGANQCGPAIADNMPITWGGPLAAFRVDDATDFDFRYLSIREIQDNPISASDLDTDGIPDVQDFENTITSSTSLVDSHIMIGDVTIQDGVVLTIPDGQTLTITSGHNLTIKSGGGILIKEGGGLKLNS